MVHIHHKNSDFVQRHQSQSRPVSFHTILNQKKTIKEVKEAFLCISRTMREFISRDAGESEALDFTRFALWFVQKYFNLNEQQGNFLLADISNSRILKSASFYFSTPKDTPGHCVYHVVTLLAQNPQAVDLSYVPLAHAHLWGVVLNDLDLHGADLSDVKMRNAKLRRVKLIEANLTNARLDNADLQEADFSNAVLQGEFSLLNSCLKGANFSNVKFEMIDRGALRYDGPAESIATINFAGSIGLNHADFSSLYMFFEKFKTKYMLVSVDRDCSLFFKRYFSHLNDHRSSLLKMIDSIDSQFDELKISLMENFIENLSGISYFRSLLHEFCDVFIQIFLNTEMVYLEKSKKIHEFLKQEFIPVFLQKSIEIWHTFSPVLCLLLGAYILEKAPKNSEFISENEKTIQALIGSCRMSKDPKFQDRLLDLNTKIQTLVYDRQED